MAAAAQLPRGLHEPRGDPASREEHGVPLPTVTAPLSRGARASKGWLCSRTPAFAVAGVPCCCGAGCDFSSGNGDRPWSWCCACRGCSERSGDPTRPKGNIWGCGEAGHVVEWPRLSDSGSAVMRGQEVGEVGGEKDASCTGPWPQPLALVSTILRRGAGGLAGLEVPLRVGRAPFGSIRPARSCPARAGGDRSWLGRSPARGTGTV